jgi:hypothetical protein
VSVFFAALFGFMPSPFSEIIMSATVLLGLVIAFRIIKMFFSR